MSEIGDRDMLEKGEARVLAHNFKNLETLNMGIKRFERIYGKGSADGEPTISLWRHRDAGQFVAEPGVAPLFFANYPHIESM